MRKSQQVPLTILAAAAVSVLGGVAALEISGCDDQPRRCVDGQNRLAPDSSCQTYSSLGYRYVYGGSTGGHFGDTVVGSSVSRGGFGGSGGDGGE